MPLDHRLNQVYRAGAGLMGLVLIVFGVFGLIDRVGFFDTHGDRIAGLNTNGSLSVLSIVVGLLLFAGMVIGGNFASTLNSVLAIGFLLSGFVNLALLRTDFNFLAFHIQNVLFSFVVGVLLMIFGMWGRVSATLRHDNPYWRARHPEEAARESRTQARARARALRRSLNEGASPQEIARLCYSPSGPPADKAAEPGTAIPEPVPGAVGTGHPGQEYGREQGYGREHGHGHRRGSKRERRRVRSRRMRSRQAPVTGGGGPG
ncbi:DUF4383 domain-containing protein [Streptomyces palmae]|uniref:DUF4383 domain-containing protein n=1 Tax=Streptomyces palmae TaxID=1701085 RepID=UPI001FD744DE|nr:DUF4383 domain-containing protein [Streptomyces palmae]